jgi:RNA polymerase sigma factor (TIGR02999 family)
MNNVAQALHSAAQGNDHYADALLPLVYDELRRLAYAHMARQSPNHTLQPTALVHEAWLRMVGDEDRTWQNRTHFFAAAATAMRNILIDHARKKSRVKRGGYQIRVDMEHLDAAMPEQDVFILMVEGALQRLEQVNPKWARIVVMKYYGGMTNQEVAGALELSESTVERYWAGAKAWLLNEISSQP